MFNVFFFISVFSLFMPCVLVHVLLITYWDVYIFLVLHVHNGFVIMM